MRFLSWVVFFLMLVGVLCGCASATDYYVSPTGSGDGLTIETPGDPSVLDASWVAGDNVNFLPGTYSDKHIIMMASGTAENPITLKKYNTTATLDGLDGINVSAGLCIDLSDNDYIIIDGLNITGYYTGVDATYGDRITVQNCNFSNLGRQAVLFSAATNSTATANTLTNIKYNHIQVGSEGATAATSVPANNVTISQNTFYQAPGHNFVDCMKNFTNIYVLNNIIHNSTYHGVYVHQTTTDGYYNSGYLYIENNTIYDTNYGIYLDDPSNNTWIENNTIYALGQPSVSSQHIKVSDPINNLTVKNNNFSDDVYSYSIQANLASSLIENNTISIPVADTHYRYLTAGTNILRNTPGIYKARNDAGTLQIDYPNGGVFTLDSGTASYTPTGSIYTQGAGVTRTVTTYNYSAKPATGTAAITPRTPVGSELCNFTANSTNENSVTFVLWGLTPGYQYRINEDGSQKSTQLANETGMISWVNSAWSEHVYTVEEGDAAAPPTLAQIYWWLRSFLWW